MFIPNLTNYVLLICFGINAHKINNIFYLKGRSHDYLSILFNYCSSGKQISKRYSLKFKKRGPPLSMDLSPIYIFLIQTKLLVKDITDTELYRIS